MRWIHALIPTFALFAGCNGCDSCFSKAQPGDVVPTATTEPAVPQTVAVDSGPAERPSSTDAGKSDAAQAPVEPALTLSAVPRPKAPMPIGAYQSCGVYDGPLCEKSCPKGNCRQECDGVECQLNCEGGYCSQVCGAEGKCKLTCKGGHCIQACTRKDACIKECAGGSCDSP
jgi:hypothetical protein